MNVPQALQDRITQKLKDCIQILEAKYNRSFKMPIVKYDLRGRVAGTAYSIKNEIQINAGLLLDPRYTEEQINNTVPHELAHLVTYVLYPETMTRQYYAWGKRTKAQPHGPRWQEVMWAMGVVPTRTHNMDTTNVKVVRSNSRTIEWKCSKCGTSFMLSPKKSEQVRRFPNSMYHRACRDSRLYEAKIFAPAPINQPDLQMANSLLQQITGDTTAKLNSNRSKLDICRQLFTQAYDHTDRGGMIELFVQSAGCTPAGAATYYQKLKSEFA